MDLTAGQSARLANIKRRLRIRGREREIRALRAGGGRTSSGCSRRPAAASAASSGAAAVTAALGTVGRTSRSARCCSWPTGTAAGPRWPRAPRGPRRRRCRPGTTLVGSECLKILQPEDCLDVDAKKFQKPDG